MREMTTNNEKLRPNITPDKVPGFLAKLKEE